jgi:glycosyltransferase involved in cell wall biosynthesis
MMQYMQKPSHGQCKASVVILTRNEIDGVRTIVPRLPQSPKWEYFVVDYRSTDGTKAFFKINGIPIVEQKTPGRGEAFSLGAKHAKADILVFFSPDGNENPKDIPTLIRCIQKGADLAIASRFIRGARNEEDDQKVKFRAWANRAFTWIANTLWRGHVTDTINGYRAITKQSLSELAVDAKGFCIEYQMTIRALKRKMKIVEIPTCEGNRIGGHTTAYAIPTGLRFLWYLALEIWIGNRF